MPSHRLGDTFDLSQGPANREPLKQLAPPPPAMSRHQPQHHCIWHTGKSTTVLERCSPAGLGRHHSLPSRFSTTAGCTCHCEPGAITLIHENRAPSAAVCASRLVACLAEYLAIAQHISPACGDMMSFPACTRFFTSVFPLQHT